MLRVISSKVFVDFRRTMASVGRYVGTTKRGLTKEFSVPVPWGEIVGKTWGDEKNPPIICLHGWLDNCNTFDKLIPLLPQDFYYVTFDVPGHGLSSHFPKGSFYFTAAYSSVLKRVIDHFKYDNVSIMGHSMGANIATYFGAIYPEIVSRIIAIDTAGIWFRQKEDLITGLRSCIDTHLAFETAEPRPEKEYTYEQAKERLRAANKNLNDESVEILLERGMRELDNGNFIFRRDIRHLFKDPLERGFETSLTIAEGLKADIFFVWAKKGLYKIIKERYPDIAEVHKAFQKNTKSFSYVEIAGNHHLHLCTPEESAKHITEFLRNHPVQKEGENGNGSNL
uniref:serine hydrolase-like protein n=1 Tax=Styela clava TaxID=7725 RepID=UPI00193A36B2|nr:serine hydrolase-like protein [Styela clava]